MLLNSWSIALCICSLAALFFIFRAAFTALKVLRFWDTTEDTNRQITLESETWLSATLIQYGLSFQIISLLLLVLAADTFSHVLTGAMCATGSFLANEYGSYSLFIKLTALFLYGFWIVLHRLDIASEYYPLVKLKYAYLLFLVPLLLVDICLQTLYLVNLDPEIITSCCGVVFKGERLEANNFLPSLSTPVLLSIYYGLALLLLLSGVYLFNSMAKGDGVVSRPKWSLFSILWAIFYPASLVAITVVFSSYIYAMPYHHCPFDILQDEYHSVGYPIYLSLLLGSFLGMSCGLVHLFNGYPGLSSPVCSYQKKAVATSLLCLTVLLLFTSYAPIRYIFSGGEY